MYGCFAENVGSIARAVPVRAGDNNLTAPNIKQWYVRREFSSPIRPFCKKPGKLQVSTEITNIAYFGKKHTLYVVDWPTTSTACIQRWLQFSAAQALGATKISSVENKVYGQNYQYPLDFC